MKDNTKTVERQHSLHVLYLYKKKSILDNRIQEKFQQSTFIALQFLCFQDSFQIHFMHI